VADGVVLRRNVRQRGGFPVHVRFAIEARPAANLN
jgi:hypothetical protein